MAENRREWALVTGASGGIGGELAKGLAARGYNLVLTGRRSEPMEHLAREMQVSHGIETVIEIVDLLEAGSAQVLAGRLADRGIEISVLVNNAGYGLFGPFTERLPEETVAMLQVNIVRLTELTSLFAQSMIARRRGKIMLVGSVAAFQPLPLYAAYAASKAYVLNFGEALRNELVIHNVDVCVLCPGATATPFFAQAGHVGFDLFLMLSSEVARAGLDALFSGRASVIPGWRNRVLVFAQRFLPRSAVVAIAGKMIRR